MNKNNSFRLNRIASNIKKSLNKIIHEELNLFDDNFLIKSFSIVEVKINKDIRFAHCFVQSYEGKDKELAVSLQNKKKYIRFLLTKELNMKFSPDIIFKPYQKNSEQNDLEKILKQISLQQGNSSTYE